MQVEKPFRRKVLLLRPEYPTYGICGSRGAGKSVLLEFILEWYYRHNYVILDWFASLDHENAYWCIPDPERTGLKVGYPVLIVLPKSTVIKQRNPLCVCGLSMAEPHECGKKDYLIKTITDDTPLKEIIELTAAEHRICIMNRGFWQDQRDFYRKLASFLHELPYLILRGVIAPSRSICLGMREAGNIAPSGLKGMKGDYETNVKRELQTYIREARHLRTVLVLDFQRASDIAKSIASQRDFLMVKRSTKDLIPDDYLWLYDSIQETKENAYSNLDFDRGDALTPISQLQPWQSVVLFPDRHYEIRRHPMASFKHKRPHDNWATDANCEITYLDKKQVDKDTPKKIEDLKRKQVEREKLDEVLKEAYQLHEDGHSWVELATKFGWLDDNGLPSPERLKMACRRWKQRQDAG